jgi:hypothetical protein
VGNQQSTEAGLEKQDGITDKITKMLELYQQRLTLDNPRLVERYLKGEIHILVRFGFGHSKQFIALFQREMNISGPDVDVHFGKSQPDFRENGLLSHHSTEIDGAIAGPDAYQKAVLVDSVKAIEHGKVSSISSIVWFECANRVYSVLPQALYFGSKTGFELIGTAVRRKLQVGMSGLAGVRNIPQLMDEMVQSAPEVLNDVSSDSGKGMRGGCCFRYVIGQLSRLRLVLGCHFIRLGFEKSFDRSMQIHEVLFGPFDFNANDCDPLVGSQNNGS